MKKTQGVEDLTRDVLASIPEPYSEDVIDEVFRAIEMTEPWISRYHQLVEELGRQDVVNNWIGKYTRQLTGLKRGWSVPSQSGLATTYSKLTAEPSA